MEEGRKQQDPATTHGRPIKVLLADDQPMMVSALKTILNTQEDIDVVATAGDGREAVEAAEKWRIDIAILDIQMPRVSGIEAAKTIKKRHDNVRVLMLTTFDTEDLVQGALEIGVQGFMLKDAGPDALIDAVRRVHDGASVLSPGVTEFVINGFRDSYQASSMTISSRDERFELLTTRELEVLERVALAETNAEIAEHLYIGAATVKTYISRLIAKLQVRDRVGLAVRAHQTGVVGNHRQRRSR